MRDKGVEVKEASARVRGEGARAPEGMISSGEHASSFALRGFLLRAARYGGTRRRTVGKRGLHTEREACSAGFSLMRRAESLETA